MTYEVVYTSVPQGLRPGSRGFCTVLRTSGIPQMLADRLESLSNYRHPFSLHSADARLNPVTFSHLELSVGGREFRVLSRICDAGLDYTQRSNFLAHHVVLDDSEQVDGGPGRILSSAHTFETQWNGAPREVSPGRVTLLRDDSPPGKCREWQRVAGDAGWAGVLAESVHNRGALPTSIIFAAGTDVLPLALEALRLIRPEQRWDVTFSTFYTRLPAGVDCQWRFILEDTDEARAARRDSQARLIDLTTRLGAASGGDLVDAARTGQRPKHWDGSVFEGALAESMRSHGRFDPDQARDRIAAWLNEVDTRETVPPEDAFPASTGPVQPRRRLQLAAATAAILLLVVCGVFVAVMSRQPEPPVIAVVEPLPDAQQVIPEENSAASESVELVKQEVVSAVREPIAAQIPNTDDQLRESQEPLMAQSSAPADASDAQPDNLVIEIPIILPPIRGGNDGKTQQAEQIKQPFDLPVSLEELRQLAANIRFQGDLRPAESRIEPHEEQQFTFGRKVTFSIVGMGDNSEYQFPMELVILAPLDPSIKVIEEKSEPLEILGTLKSSLNLLLPPPQFLTQELRGISQTDGIKEWKHGNINAHFRLLGSFRERVKKARAAEKSTLRTSRSTIDRHTETEQKNLEKYGKGLPPPAEKEREHARIREFEAEQTLKVIDEVSRQIDELDRRVDWYEEVREAMESCHFVITLSRNTSTPVASE